jgi:hypothetical protein
MSTAFSDTAPAPRWIVDRWQISEVSGQRTDIRGPVFAVASNRSMADVRERKTDVKDPKTDNRF